MSSSGRIIRVLAAALAFSAMASANAATIQLRAWLNAAQVPLALGGTGLGTVSFDTGTKVLSWSVSYTGLSGDCTLAHFHGPAAAGVNADPTVDMTCSVSPLTGESAPLSPTQEAQLVSGQLYINIHTAANSGGEIRGQVVVVKGDVSGDGQSDVLWRNGTTGENYLYPMNGTTILGSEGYLRTVADQNWQMVGIGDFDGDGKADVLWRNGSTGENYLYLMNGTTIVGEGYIRTVADQAWQVAGVADFNGDGKADILWRNKAGLTPTGENYLYPMDGTTILGSEGYLRTVADQNWQVVKVGDFNGDGRADVLWRNSLTGENYIYPMDGTTILGTEGYIRTVADQSWQVAGAGDFGGDGRSDILWRNGSTGENYIYPMAGLTILATEGYIRTVADQNWQVAALGDYNGDGKSDILWRNSATDDTYFYLMDGLTVASEGYGRNVPSAWKVMPPAGTISGLEFPRNDQVPDGQTVRFKFTDPHTSGLPIYGPGGNGVTYIFKVRPKQQAGFYTTFFWANDDDQGTLSTFLWKEGVADSYYGAHPYPTNNDNTGTEHNWEISIEQDDFVNGLVVKDQWYTQVVRVWSEGNGNKQHEFYWDWPNTDPAHRVTHTAPSTWGNTNPPSPALTFGDAPWQPGRELCSCTLRGIQIYSSLLSLEDIQNEIASPKSTVAGSASIWYLNLNPTPTDISDKSGVGHHPAWVGPNRPSLYLE